MRLSLLKSLAVASVLSLSAGATFAQGIAGNYLAGRAAATENDYEAASLYYSRLLVANPSNAFLLENLVLANLSLGHLDKAIPVAARLDGLEGVESQLANMALVADHAAKGEFDAIIARIKEIAALALWLMALCLHGRHLGQGI